MADVCKRINYIPRAYFPFKYLSNFHDDVCCFCSSQVNRLRASPFQEIWIVKLISTDIEHGKFKIFSEQNTILGTFLGTIVKLLWLVKLFLYFIIFL